MEDIDREDPYADLVSASPPRSRFRFLRRIIPIVLVLATFYGLWRFLPHNIVFWIVLAFLALLTWIATYGWKQALSALIETLKRIEQI